MWKSNLIELWIPPFFWALSMLILLFLLGNMPVCL
jgi:hypothetical protein